MSFLRQRYEMLSFSTDGDELIPVNSTIPHDEALLPHWSELASAIESYATICSSALQWWN